MIIQMLSSAEYFATIFDEQVEIKVGVNSKIFIVNRTGESPKPAKAFNLRSF
jgi:hypothetical protein